MSETRWSLFDKCWWWWSLAEGLLKKSRQCYAVIENNFINIDACWASGIWCEVLLSCRQHVLHRLVLAVIKTCRVLVCGSASGWHWVNWKGERRRRRRVNFPLFTNIPSAMTRRRRANRGTCAMGSSSTNKSSQSTSWLLASWRCYRVKEVVSK